MVMKSSSTIACMLVLVLVQATQDIPCVSARDLVQQFSGSRNGFNRSNVFGVPNAAASSPPAPRSSTTVNIPGVNDLTKGLTASEGIASGLINATTALINGLSNTLGAPPANFSDAAGLVNGVTSGRLANATNGVISALTNATREAAKGIADAASGVTNAFGSPSRSSASSPSAEEASGTTITETFYISSTGLGSTQLTATTHFPPLSEIQIPDLKSIFINLLSKQSSSADSPPKSTTSSSQPPPPPTGLGFPGFH